MSSLQLDPDRALPFPAEQRSIAREIYGETKDLPLICMHGHVEPEVFAGNTPFADPAQLLIVPDHYVFRMLASQGIEPACLGVPRNDGDPVETDSRKIWRTFCENWKLFRGTPSRYWLEHELVEVFGVDLVPSVETADAISVRMDLPGHDAKDIHVNVENDVLTVRSERKTETQEKGETLHRSERSYGLYTRSFVLPAPVDAQKAEARYENGVLSVTLPKREDAKPRSIDVRVNS